MMQRKNILNDLFQQETLKESDIVKTQQISKFMQCFNLTSNNRSRQIRILQIGTPGIGNVTKKPFLTTQPVRKQITGLFNNQILAKGNNAAKDIFLASEGKKIGYLSEPASVQKMQSKTISPEKNVIIGGSQYLAINSSPLRSRGWLSKKKRIQQLPRQFFRRNNHNQQILNQQQIQVDQNVSKSLNLLNKIKMVEQLKFNDNYNKTSILIQPKPKSRVEPTRKTPQEIAEEERKNKLQIKRQISQDYAKPFNPPSNITAQSYIIFQPKFSENKGRKRKYYIQSDDLLQESVEKNKKKYPHSHKVITSLNSRNAVQIASLTKIMTCVLALELCQRFKLNSLQEKILIGKFQSNIGGTSAQICEGETYTLEDLYYGLMLPSGNDASVAIAVWGGRVLLSGQQAQQNRHKKKEFYQRFILEMNNKSRQLGMHKTNYANSHGLVNSENKSCAFDLAILCEHAMQIPKFREIVSCRIYRSTIWCSIGNSQIFSKKGSVKDFMKEKQKDDEIQQGQQKDLDSNQEEQQINIECNIAQRSIEWENTHRLVQTKPNQYIGIKTGITTAAGPCLASCVKSNGRFFIIVVLNCDKLSMRFKDTENLKKWIYQREGISSPRKRKDSLKQKEDISPREQEQYFSPESPVND